MSAERYRGLTSSVLETIRQDCRSAPGLEQCGLLLTCRGSSTISSCLGYSGPLQPRAFRLPQEWLLAAFLQARSAAKEVVGFYHSHPEGEALAPSLLDRAGHPPGSVVLLVSDSDWRAYRSGPRWRPMDLNLLSS